MRYSTAWIFSLILTTNVAFSQVSEEKIPFNQQAKSQVGIGFSTTSFSANFTYFISPSYSFRYHRHWFGFTPFYGRLDAISKQKDIGIGVDYRLYPFKNLSNTFLYFPVGVHYNYKWTGKNNRKSMFYKFGFGLEAFIGEQFSISLDANMGIGQAISKKTIIAENDNISNSSILNYYFLPVVRLSYQLQ